MKQFLKKLLFLLPIPFLVISVNFIADPANLFNEKYESGIADYLSNGYNVTNVINCDERLLQKYFIDKMNTCPSTIALGASRIFQINSGLINETNFINNGVSGATLEDHLAIYYLYEKKGCKIKKVILGLEPYYLNDNHEQARWKSLEHEYSIFSNKLNNKIPTQKNDNETFQYSKYKELLSFSYFKTSLTYLMKGGNKNYLPTKKMINIGLTRLNDGAIYYDSIYRNASVDEVEKKAKKEIAETPMYCLGNFTKLSEKYKLIFSNFIEYLQKQNIEVEFYLSPYHPIVYNYFQKNSYYHIIEESEKYYKDYATTHKIKVLGSYDPAKYNFDNSYFLDGFHCNNKAIEKILKSDAQ